MSSDPAKPQPGEQPTERPGTSTSPKASAAPAPPVESVVPSEQSLSGGSRPAEAATGADVNPSSPTVESSGGTRHGPTSPGMSGSPTGKRATASPTTAGLTPPILLQLPNVVTVDVKRDFLRDFGVLVPSALSVVVTLIIAILAHQINQKQAESLTVQSRAALVQSQAAQEEVNVKFIEEFRKHLGELTLPEEEENEAKNQANLAKKKLAAITLAQYGERALPTLKMSLAVEDEDIRGGAVVVVVQMLSDKNLREGVLSKLGQYFDESNASLRVGILDCYLTINRDLNEKEFTDAKNKIKQYVTPSANYADKPQEQRVLLWATKFFSNWPNRDSRDFLLAVARNPTCGNDSREGAINYLPSVTLGTQYSSDSEREESKQEVLLVLQGLSAEAPERLKANIGDAIAKLQATEGSK